MSEKMLSNICREALKTSVTTRIVKCQSVFAQGSKSVSHGISMFVLEMRYLISSGKLRRCLWSKVTIIINPMRIYPTDMTQMQTKLKVKKNTRIFF